MNAFFAELQPHVALAWLLNFYSFESRVWRRECLHHQYACFHKYVILTDSEIAKANPVLYIFAIIFPPLAVWLIPHVRGYDIGVNILLTLLGWVPGVLRKLLGAMSPKQNTTHSAADAWYLIANPPSSSGVAYIKPRSSKHGRSYSSYDRDQRRHSQSSRHAVYVPGSGRDGDVIYTSRRM